MKKLFILMIFAAILTACNNSSAEKRIEEITTAAQTSDITKYIETTATASTDSTDNETAVSTSAETSQTEASSESDSSEMFADDGGVRLIDKIYGLPKISKGYLISHVTDRGGKITNTTEHVECTVALHDVKTGELVTEFPMPKGYEIEEIVVGGEGLCNVVLKCYYVDSSSETGFSHEYRTALINEDFSIAVGDYTPESVAINVCDRKIAEWEADIVDAENGDVLIAGFINEDNFYENRQQLYMFPLDENRFVYRTGGVERLPGFGIYDFSTGTAMDVPDSKDLIPFGVYDRKIYSAYSAWDGFGTDIYITDTETLETELYIDLDTEVAFNGYWLSHFMYMGEIFILGENPTTLFKLTPDGVEVVYEYPEKYSSFFHTSLDPESGILYSNYAIHDVGNGAILVDLNML